MNSRAYIPSTAPFTTEQRAWLNGFLAGMLPPESGESVGAPRSAATAKSLVIFYGSQTGSAEKLAKDFGKQAARVGYAPMVCEANAFASADLRKKQRLVLITSTWGDGDPPDNAAGFWAHINAENAPELKNVSYAVLALGDINYSDFCGAGRKFDERLEKLGAKRLLARTDCDVDYEAAAKTWMEAALTALARVADDEAAASDEGALPSAPAPEEAARYSRANPFPGRLLASRNLNAMGSAKETRHVEISLEGSALTYEPGDALGVFPSNCPSLVTDILSALGFDGEEAVNAPNGAETSFRSALLKSYQVTQPPAAFVRAVAERSGSSELGALLAPENKGRLDEYLNGREIIDLLLGYPKARFTPGELVSLLRPLNPRLYSIASSLKAHAGQVHLCVGVVRFETHGRSRQGVCSTFLASRADTQTPVPVFIQTSHGFRLPGCGDVPIIMVGPGTGIAPFRAFLEERRAGGSKGRNWLLFGDQRRETDFLYREELEPMVKDGVLTRLDLAFSRDQEEKVYVQNRLLENAAEVYAWLEEGAHFYVCGDAKRMAKDVDMALRRVIEIGGGKSAGQAAEYVAALKTAKRYQRDVY